MARFLPGGTAILALLAALAACPGRAGVLDSLRSDVRDGAGSDSSSSSRDDDHKHRHDRDDDDGGVLGLLISGILAGDGHDHGQHHDGSMYGDPGDGAVGVYQAAPARPARFARFPYDGVPGYMVIGPWPDGPSVAQDYPADAADPGQVDSAPLYPMQGASLLRDWSGRVRCDWAGDFHDLQRVGGHVLLSSTSGFEVETEFVCFQERLGCGAHDQLWLGDANLLFRLLETERLMGRIGVGFNWLGDRFGADAGFNFTMGLDWFPVRPLVFSSTIDLGTLGRAGLFHFRTTAGVIVRRYEVYTGYEYYDVGNTQWNALVGGVRVWL